MTLSLNVARMQAVKPSATLGMAAKAKALSKQGVDVVNLSAGEPEFATPHCIVDAARRVLDKRSSHAYTAPRGTDDLLEAIGIKLAREQGLNALSMGMSADYETAVRMGATHVRVGSALFGNRPPLETSAPKSDA